MGWETRTRGTRYYTRSRRVGGRVVREYVGAGPLAEMLAEEDAEDRAQRRHQRGGLDAERRRLSLLDAPAARLSDLADALAASALLLAGYRRHDRGDWRKRRDHQEQGPEDHRTGGE